MSDKVYTRQQLIQILKQERARQRVVVTTNGCFDLLHAGHILMLKDAKKQCDNLIVGLQTDPTIDRPEKNQPIQSFEERKIQLEAIKYIDKIITYSTEKELYELLRKINPDIRILGTDYIDQSFTGDDLDIKIHYHKRSHDYSTSSLRKKIYLDEKKK